MHLFVVPAEGGTARQITRGKYQYGAGPFSWAPEGESLVFSAVSRKGAELYERGDTEVFEVSVAEGSVVHSVRGTSAQAKTRTTYGTRIHYARPLLVC